MDWRPPGSSVHGTVQVRTEEWVVMSSSRRFSLSRDRTHISCHLQVGSFTTSAPWEAQEVLQCLIEKKKLLVKWTLTFQTHIVSGSTVIRNLRHGTQVFPFPHTMLLATTLFFLGDTVITLRKIYTNSMFKRLNNLNVQLSLSAWQFKMQSPTQWRHMLLENIYLFLDGEKNRSKLFNVTLPYFILSVICILCLGTFSVFFLSAYVFLSCVLFFFLFSFFFFLTSPHPDTCIWFSFQMSFVSYKF